MTTDWRALCAELVKELDDLRESSEGVAGFHRNGDLAPWSELGESGEFPWLSSFDRARAALAQPEPEGPVVWTEGICGDGAALLRDGVMVPIEEVVQELNEGAWARAVLARWGCPATPVPVSERLPGPEDCDGEGKVWAIAYLNAWMRVHHSMISRWKAWLPANALPLPAGEETK